MRGAGPLYEIDGPKVDQVRKDVVDHLCASREFFWPHHIVLFESTLVEVIPETRNDFGSIRGYTTSGVMEEISEEVLVKYNEEKNILYKKINKLIPYIKYKLYNPNDGWIMKKVMIRFNNNKNKFKSKKSNK